MTPYATLLVRPADTDEQIRRAYHALAKLEHPDATRGVPTVRWFAITAAYTAVKTAAARATLERQQKLLAGMCKPCSGYGVTGSRAAGGRIKVCAACQGEGRKV